MRIYKMRSIFAISLVGFSLAGCGASVGVAVDRRPNPPEPVFYQVEDMRQVNFIRLVAFMHVNRDRQVTEEMVDTMHQYIKDAGMTRECQKSCFLRYRNKVIVITPEYIQIESKNKYQKFDDPHVAVRHIYS